MLDSPPPSTITSGSSRLITCASPRASRSAWRSSAACARVSPAAARAGMPEASCAPSPSQSRASDGPAIQVSRQPRWPHQHCRPGSSSGCGQGSGLWPHSPVTWLRPRSTLPSTTTPPPQPVPRMTPNTDAVAGAGAVGRFREREAVGVVLHPHLAVEQGADVAIERVAVQRDRVGVLHQAGGRADHAGDADADGGGDAELGFGVAHQARRCPPAMPGSRAACRCDGGGARCRPGSSDGDLDLGAAEVDADAVLHGGALRGGW